MKHLKLYESYFFQGWSDTEIFIYYMRQEDEQGMSEYINKIDIDSYYDEHYTLLITACLECSYTGIKFLLENGANPYLINIYGHDAYYYADKKGQKIIRKMFPDFHEKREIFKNAAKYNL